MKIFNSFADYIGLIAIGCFFVLFLASIAMGESAGFGDKVDDAIQDKIAPIREMLKGDYDIKPSEKKEYSVQMTNNKVAERQYMCIGKCETVTPTTSTTTTTFPDTKPTTTTSTTLPIKNVFEVTI
jgi:hypothetical protein